MVTAQNIFPLYLNGKTMVKTPEGIKVFAFFSFDLSEFADSLVNNLYLLSGCQLILKRLSSMGEEDATKLRNAFFIDVIAEDGDRPFYEVIQEYVQGDAQIQFSLENNVDIILWLLDNGYALDDSWFESQNGNPPIAVEETL